MQSVTTIGLDIAKSVFQVHGVDADGKVVVRRQLKRRYVLAFFQKLPPCLVGIEACASSHYWSRELQALGHTVRLMPPAYVKPYVKRQKNDAADAEAICEAVTRPNMRFVATKTPEQQSCLTLHRTRHLFIRQQTAVINSTVDARRMARRREIDNSLCCEWIVRLRLLIKRGWRLLRATIRRPRCKKIARSWPPGPDATRSHAPQAAIGCPYSGSGA